mmetsp:Transcript_6045/g.10467  ORF Transcript_6045/g.10467 Transcript_6045/m.10467 type:complete len:114 (-) Transcript_6045:93-434(-)
MPGKAKSQNHTAKEINAKLHANKMEGGGAGGGATGVKFRNSMGKVMLTCTVCGQPNFNAVNDMKAHYDSKHSKLPFDAEFYTAKQTAAKESTAGEMEKLKNLGKSIAKTSKKS